jgi:TRAP-type uncharacterized transport system fused permease subunit
LGASIEGWLFFHGRISTHQRILTLATGVLLLYPSWGATVAAVVIFIALLISLKMFSLPRNNVNIKH